MAPFLKYQNPIFYYHRVGVSTDTLSPSISQVAFQRQMCFLSRGGRAVSLETLVATWASDHRTLPKKSAVTFDDGYGDVYTHAFPILESFRIPTTVFLIVDAIGKQDFLTWPQVREMSKKGVSFGSHTRTHRYLPSLSSEKALHEEIVDSKKILEDQLGEPVSFLSYPLGGYTNAAKEKAKEAGYRAAFTTNRGHVRHREDLYAVTRIKMTERSSSYWVLQAKTSGYYEQFKRRKKPC